ncbi:hypothetical protein J6590_097126 [Homalodisca vitripennis]|nr:hypothetical protein J6590_097126 [Homalodisca vitripennis]
MQIFRTDVRNGISAQRRDGINAEKGNKAMLGTASARREVDKVILGTASARREGDRLMLGMASPRRKVTKRC